MQKMLHRNNWQIAQLHSNVPDAVPRGYKGENMSNFSEAPNALGDFRFLTKSYKVFNSFMM